MNTSSKNIVLWSGGFDSTALMLKTIQETGLCDIQHVTFLSLNCKNFSTYDKDIESRKRIKEKLKEYCPSMYNRMNFIELESCDNVINFGTQAPHIAYLSVYDSFDNSCQLDIHYGYIKDDCIFHHKHEFKTMVQSMVSFTNSFRMISKTVELKFPFEWETKESILKYYSRYPEIFDCLQWASDPGDDKLKYKFELKKMLDFYKESDSWIQYTEGFRVNDDKKVEEPKTIDVIDAFSGRSNLISDIKENRDIPKVESIPFSAPDVPTKQEILDNLERTEFGESDCECCGPG